MRAIWLAAMILPGAPVAAQESCRPVPEALVALNACEGTARVSLMAVGDVLFHQPLQWRGYARGFSTIWGARRSRIPRPGAGGTGGRGRALLAGVIAGFDASPRGAVPSATTTRGEP